VLARRRRAPVRVLRITRDAWIFERACPGSAAGLFATERFQVIHPLVILLIGTGVVIGGILVLRLHAFLALVLAALAVAVLTAPETVYQYAIDTGLSPGEALELSTQPIAERVADGFGRTIGQIGIVIAMASVIGICLLESGGADRIVRSALNRFGAHRAPHVFAGSSLLLSIPVFFDTVFYLMMPLAKSMRLRTGRYYLFYILAIVSGGAMAHSLIPPTPGPLFIAEELGIDIGVMMLGGFVVGLPATAAGFMYAAWAERRWGLPLNEPPEAMERLKLLTERTTDSLPSLQLALLPILLPVALIAASTILASSLEGDATSWWEAFVFTLGEKNMALIIGAAVGLAMLMRSYSLRASMPFVRDALLSAGLIVLIIGAGGAFGQVLQQTGIAATMEQLAGNYRLAVLPVAFLITAAIRGAQGSATVAMITAAGAFAGIASAAQLGFHPAYLALAIGCGSLPLWWMNDSAFWIITKMSGMSEDRGLLTLTPILSIMGTAGFAALMLLAVLFPLA